MEDAFETTGQYNRKLFKALSPFAYPVRRKLWERVFSALAVALGVANLLFGMAGNWVLSAAMWLVPFLFLGQRLALQSRYVSSRLESLTRLLGKPETTETTRFDQEGYLGQNHDTGITVRLAYQDIALVCQAKEYFFLKTKDNRFGVVFRGGLDAKRQQALLALLEGK